jgi:hypothetical protein
MQKGELPRRLENQCRAKEGLTGPNWAQSGRPRPVGPTHFGAQSASPFDLGAPRAIYSPLTESHTSIHSSSAAKEQRSLRDTFLERRVVLVV